MKNCYTYDDVLLVPQYSDIKSRNEVSLNSKLNSFNDDEDSVIFKLPIISSPMDTVTEDIMANAIYNAGGFGII
ncbi:MAG: IMP dehydrogenase, partial [Alphaproteobacteria bacterium]|nr:IMP dehydrogenase [Alphaproteobacteria bacterium]